jgi:hypothetical protein
LPKRGNRVLPLSEKVKVLDVMKKKNKKALVEAAHIYRTIRLCCTYVVKIVLLLLLILTMTNHHSPVPTPYHRYPV